MIGVVNVSTSGPIIYANIYAFEAFSILSSTLQILLYISLFRRRWWNAKPSLVKECVTESTKIGQGDEALEEGMKWQK